MVIVVVVVVVVVNSSVDKLVDRHIVHRQPQSFDPNQSTHDEARLSYCFLLIWKCVQLSSVASPLYDVGVDTAQKCFPGYDKERGEKREYRTVIFGHMSMPRIL